VPIWAPEALNKGIRAHLSTYVRGHLNHTMSKAKISVST